MTVVSICAPLSLDPTAAIKEAAARAGATVDVRYEPSILPPQRFPADHAGDPAWRRSADDAARWNRLLAGTDIALGVPGDTPAGLLALVAAAPAIAWVQGTAAGAGEQARRAGLAASIAERLVLTSAAGIHATPLAEFAVFGLLSFVKDLDRLLRHQRAANWPGRWPMRQLRGSRVLLLGLGGVGREVARLCAAFGAQVTGVRRNPDGPVVPGVALTIGLDDLDQALPGSDAVIVTLPGTPATVGLLDAHRLAMLPPHAILVNVGRGTVVDHGALVAALDTGRLRGAVLDVTDPEPLPASSPLWRRDDVLISPHTAALRVDEDDRLVDLFADNLERWLTGRPLRNVVDLTAGY